MNELVELYKEHINPDPDGSEIHHFMTSFISVWIRNPDPEVEKMQEIFRQRDQMEARKWILRNSKKNTMNKTPSHSPVSDLGQAPIVEFLTIRGNMEESYERNRLEEMGQIPEFACKDDYMTNIVIDMDNVIDYCVGKTYLNGQELECVYPNMYGMGQVPLLCSPEVFKKIYQESRNIKIKSFQEWK